MLAGKITAVDLTRGATVKISNNLHGYVRLTDLSDEFPRDPSKDVPVGKFVKVVVLNDNCMSIDPNVGALKEYLTDITTSHAYNKVKDEVWNILGKISKFGPNAQAIAQKVEHAVKSAVLKQV